MSEENDNRKPVAERRLAPCDDLLAAVKAWRTAEVHHAAITLDMRDGDEQLAKAKLDDATRELRIAADKYLKAANAAMSDRADSAGRNVK